MEEFQSGTTAEPQMTPPVLPDTLGAPGQVLYPYPAAKQEKKKWELHSFDRPFAWIAVLLGFLLMRYAFFYADGFFTTGCFLLLYFVSALYIRFSGCKPTLPQRIFGCVICAFTLVFSLTASPLLHGLCFCFLLPAIVWRTHAVCGGKGFVTRFFPFDLGSSGIAKPIQHFTAGPQAMLSSQKNSAATNTVKHILIGLLVTIPLTIVVGILLASADSGIADMFEFLSDLPDIEIGEIFWQIVFGIPLGIWLFAILYSASKRKEQPFPVDAFYEGKLAALRMIPNAGLYAGVTPICLLYLAYVISQTNYFLSAFAGRLPEGMIYSEYARRGFFELCAIAVINLLVILVLTGCAKKGGTDRPKLLTVYAVTLCIFTLFIIATALAKMVLYIHAYGMTQLRIYTTWFMVLLAVVFLVLLLRQFSAKLPTAAVLTGVFIVMFAGLCFSRPDARIAEYNLRRCAEGTLKDMDIDMLCDLSEDAYNVMAQNRELLEQEGLWDYFLEKAEMKTDYEYGSDQYRKWNMSAQILLQQLHTDTTR